MDDQQHPIVAGPADGEPSSRVHLLMRRPFASESAQFSIRRQRRIRVGAWTAVFVLFVGAFIISLISVSEVFDCSSPSKAELLAQQKFVESHVPDAASVELSTRDCDDDGDGFFHFTTTLTPDQAREAFLRDDACSIADVAALVCRSDGFDVYLSFDDEDSGLTHGYLDMSR